MFKKIRAFLEEVRGELKRVSWPKRDELTRSTSVVLIMIVSTALIIGLLDFVFYRLILISLGTR
jgi:preprotein translocase subunit SecE